MAVQFSTVSNATFASKQFDSAVASKLAMGKYNVQCQNCNKTFKSVFKLIGHQKRRHCEMNIDRMVREADERAAPFFFG